MQIIEKTTLKVIGTTSNKAIINIPSKIADKMKLGKGVEVTLTLNENMQLVVERSAKHDSK